MPALRLIAAALSAVAITATASPSFAAAGEGTLSLTIADDRGAPMTALVYRVDATGMGAQVGAAVAPNYSEAVPAGTYGLAVVGGWGGMTCVHLAPCSWLSIQGAPMAARPTAGAPVVGESATTPVTATVATPKLSGAGAIGSPLTIIVPPGLTDLANVYTLQPGNGGSVEPGVTWLRNGAAIPGASGLSYVPTAADAGTTISAVVAYPAALTIAWGTAFPALVPGPLTTTGVSVPALTLTPTPPTKVAPTISLSVPTRVTQGKRPKVYVNVKDGTSPVSGVVKLRVGKQRAQQANLRSGLATFTLPRLKPGRYVLTATYVGTTSYDAVTTTKKVTVKKKKSKRR